MIQQGIDISNYSGYITQAWANAVVAAGIQRATVRCSLERPYMVDIAIHQVGAFRNAGADVDGYVWAYPRADNPDVLAARVQGTYGTLSLPIYWLDCEDEDGWSYEDSALNIDWLQRALAGFDALGLPVGVYTGRWWWVKPNRMANTQAFRDRLLWTSDFDLNPDLGVWHRYGGWEENRLAGKQWCGESSGPQAYIAGVAVDRSTWDTALLPDGANGGDDLSAEEKAELENLRNYVGGLSENVLRPGLAAIEAAADGQTGRRWTTVRAQVAAIRKGSGVEK